MQPYDINPCGSRPKPYKRLELNEMKKFLKHITLSLLVIGYATQVEAQSSLGTPNCDPSAIFELASTKKGFLIPRMTTAEMTAISSPATGLMIYNTSQDQFRWYDGSHWDTLYHENGGGGLGDNLGDHVATQNIELDGNWLSNDGGNEGVFVSTSGLVGINTNSPSYDLEVNGNGYFEDELTVDNYINIENGWSTPYTWMDEGIRFGTDTDYAFIGQRYYSSDNVDFTIVWGDNYADDLVFYNYDYAAGGTLSEYMRLTGYGNLGIGTASPTETVHIDGTFRFVDGNEGLGKVLTSSATGVATWQTISGTADDLGNHIATQNIELDGNWLSNDGGNEGVYVSTSGNVGINTPFPSEALHVDGSIRIVDGSQGTGKVLVSNATGVGTWTTLSTSGSTNDGWHGDTTRIKILPNPNSYQMMITTIEMLHIEDDEGTIGVEVMNSNLEMFAAIPIPAGFEATHVRIYGDNTDNVEVFEVNYTTW